MNYPNSVKAYSRASHTVSKTRQLVMLYDGAIRFMQQGVEAIETRDFETRYNKLTRVSDILIGLQSCLDFEVGGDTAKVLYDFYSSIDLRIFAIHRTNDLEECRKIIVQLKEMRDTWDAIDRGPETKPEVAAEQSTASATPAGGDSITVSA